MIEYLYKRVEENDKLVVQSVERAAADRGLPMAQISLAWVLAKSEVTAPIVGVTKSEHLADAVAALDVDLSSEEIRTVEMPYVPHPYSGLFPQTFKGRTSVI